jgi:glycine/D-amino acid oxidase-like deaminating enzyme
VSAAEMQRRGMPVELLEGAARLQEITGTDRYQAGLIDRSGGNLNPLSYARGLAEAAINAGATIHGGTPATSIARAEGGWRIATPRGALTAERVVLATNAYTDDLWPGLRRSVVPVFSAIAASAPIEAALARRIMPGRPSLYEIASLTTYYRLDWANRLLIGGRGRQGEIADAAELRHLRRYAERLFPGLAGIRWTHGWSGQLAITADHYPHLHEPADGVVACLGYNGRGVAMASAMGAEIAKRVLDRQAAIDMPITGIREIPFHGLWRAGVALRVLDGRIRDRLGL